MKRVFWLVFVFLLIAVPVLSSCTQNVPEAPPEVETEPTQTATQTPTPTPEPTQTVTQTPPPTPEPKPASFSINGLTITPKEVTAGSSVAIEVMVTNSGELPGTYDVTLKIDDTIEDTKKITLEGGASQKVTFSVTKWTARAYSVSIAGQSGTLAVKSLPLPPLDAFMKGIHFNDWRSFNDQRYVLFPSLQTEQSLKNLAATGPNWISIIVVFGQETIASTTVFRNSPATATDADLLRVINLAHSLGLRVMLFPSLMLSNDTNHWWHQIRMAFTTEAQWQDWFASYRETINHYASFAQEAGVDMLSIGRELGGVTHREDDWRRVIKEVRERFKGPITYSSLNTYYGLNTAFWDFPHSEENRIKWWDAVDYIGVTGYYQLTNENDPTVEELKAAWIQRGHIALLESLSGRFKKPIIITEIGYVNKDGNNKMPSDFWINTPTDSQEQADCYQAALEVLWGKPWLKGIFWWQWSATPVPRPEDPQGKTAEEIIKKFYLPPDKPQ